MLLDVALYVPPDIVRGLATGALELVGGVVRDRGSKQVVMWLREGAQIANNSNLAAGALKSVLDVGSGGMAGVAFGALDAVVSTYRHNQIMQQFSALTNLVGMVGGIGVLNIGVSAVSTAIVLKRMKDLEKAIESLHEHISKEFSNARQAKMEAAIQTAEDAFNMENSQNISWNGNSALGKLYEARQQIWYEINLLKGSANSAENNQLMQENLLQAMQLDIIRGRCLVAVGEECRAKKYFADNLSKYLETSRLLVHRHLGEHRAVYFHKSVVETDLLRYLAIEQWLHGGDYRLMEILLATRHDFWNPDLADHTRVNTEGKSTGFKLPFKPKEASDDRPHIEVLTQSELLIENHRRFEGILAEIEAIELNGFTHVEWEKLQEEAMAKADISVEEHDDYVLLIDREWLAEQSEENAA